MTRDFLIKELFIIINEIKLHVDCCNHIFNFLEITDKGKDNNLINFIYGKIPYFYFDERNHIQLIILTLNSLLNPTKGELSPFDKALKLSRHDLNKLRNIKNVFIKENLHHYRNKVIAHKELYNMISKERRYNISTDINLFRTVENIYINLHNWLNDCFPNYNNFDIMVLFSKGLKEILDLIILDRINHNHDFVKAHFDKLDK